MRYIVILTSFIVLSSCSSNINKSNDKLNNIDIYQNDMTYEKFKQYALEYAKKSQYPNLVNK